MSSAVPPTQRRAIIKTVLILFAVMALIMALFLNKFFSPRVMSKQELMANGAVVFDTPRKVREFNLLDEEGQPFTLEELQGKWSLLFFGFTHCPDICPLSLMKLDSVYEALNESIQSQTQVILVSVDPARDAPDKLKAYVEHFNPSFKGITGDFIDVKRLADNLNVAFNKVVLEEGYTVDHTGNIVLINPRGHYHGFFRPPFELARLKTAHQSIVSSF